LFVVVCPVLLFGHNTVTENADATSPALALGARNPEPPMVPVSIRDLPEECM